MYNPSKLVVPELAYSKLDPNKIKQELNPMAVGFIVQKIKHMLKKKENRYIFIIYL
jgi:pyrrolidone-carboxylate peptidase